MTAKEYLSEAIRLKRLIKKTESQIEDIKEMATSVGAIRYDKDNIQNSPNNDAMANYMIRLEAAESRARDLIIEYLEAYMTIEQQIRKIMPGIYADVLYLRYIDGKNLDQIAEELNYSADWIRHVHGYALRTFDQQFLKHDTQKHIKTCYDATVEE